MVDRWSNARDEPVVEVEDGVDTLIGRPGLTGFEHPLIDVGRDDPSEDEAFLAPKGHRLVVGAFQVRGALRDTWWPRGRAR